MRTDQRWATFLLVSRPSYGWLRRHLVVDYARRREAQNGALDADLTAINAALAELSDAELHALIAVTNGVPPVAYGLLVWIEGASAWELNRRAGHDYDLLPQGAAIVPPEDAVSIDAVLAMRATFAQDSSAVPVLIVHCLWVRRTIRPPCR